MVAMTTYKIKIIKIWKPKNYLFLTNHVLFLRDSCLQIKISISTIIAYYPERSSIIFVILSELISSSTLIKL